MDTYVIHLDLYLSKIWLCSWKKAISKNPGDLYLFLKEIKNAVASRIKLTYILKRVKTNKGHIYEILNSNRTIKTQIMQLNIQLKFNIVKIKFFLFFFLNINT